MITHRLYAGHGLGLQQEWYEVGSYWREKERGREVGMTSVS